MKVQTSFLTGSKFWIVCGVLSVASISRSVLPQTDPKKGPTNAAPAPVPVPQAVFTIPRSQQEGMRDPFFPKSTRIFAHAMPLPVVTGPAPVILRADLKLQGMSGPANHRLPIINGRTFELNEEAEVNTTSG